MFVNLLAPFAHEGTVRFILCFKESCLWHIHAEEYRLEIFYIQRADFSHATSVLEMVMWFCVMLQRAGLN